MRIGVGIDTGGTYTDAVIYDFDNKIILGSAKSLTTKDDLSVGILGAIDALPPEILKQASIISLSTTLATNACVEDKGGDAKLVFFGGNAKAIDELGGKYGLPNSREIYIQKCHTQFSGEIGQEPDWEQFANELTRGYEHLDGVGIVEIFATKTGGYIEKKAKDIFQRHFDIPVVCGHELFSALNCLQRGSSTLLNARLFPIIKEFLTAVKKALEARGICATLVIVRSDGSLMSEDFASLRPVETLLCGPAASAIGGARLAQSVNSIIVDMGGTTTDIAFVKDNIPVTVSDGVSIGKWKTFVDGLYVKTFGLGGDSAIHYGGGKLRLEDYRVVPICTLAHEYPEIIENLQSLEIRKHNYFLYEHYILVKDISLSPKYTHGEKAFCDALKNGPLIFSKAAEAVGKDIYTLDVKKLVADGIVQISGLTPTDIMHIKGDFDKYCTSASMLVAEFVAYNLDMSVQELCDLAYDQVKKKLYLHIVKALYENRYPHYMMKGISEDVERFILDSYDSATKGESDLLSTMICTNYTLVGVGAPIKVFLDDVAKLLGATAIIPAYYEVANALGAITGSVNATCTVEVRPNYDKVGITGYTVYSTNGRKTYEKLECATEYATKEAKDGAVAEALKRGAVGEVTVTASARVDEAEGKDCVIYLGTAVTASAVGAVGF